MPPTHGSSDPRLREPTRETEPAARTAVPIQQRITALQQSAGNHAVGRLLRAEATMSDDSRKNVQRAFAFWQEQLKKNSPAEAKQNIKNPPEDVEGVVPAGRAATAPPEPESEAAEAEGAEAVEIEAEAAEPEPERRRNTPEESARARQAWQGVGGAARRKAGSTSKKILPGRGAEHIPDAGRDEQGEHAKRYAGSLKPLDLEYWLEEMDEQHRPGHKLAGALNDWLATGYGSFLNDWLPHNDSLLGSKTVTYMDADERARHMLLAKESRLWQRKPGVEIGDPEKGLETGKPDDYAEYDTASSASTFGGASGWAIFVVSSAGIFYAANSVENELHHSSLLAGASVRAAGEIRVIGGKLMGLTPLSGHYKPGNDHLLYALQQLAARGVDVGSAVVGDAKPSTGKLELTWFGAADYLANGAGGTPVAAPPGRPADKGDDAEDDEAAA